MRVACSLEYPAGMTESNMTVTFWGVRGSIASPGPHTAQVGGNTSCVEVRCGDERLILDAGTGLRSLGDAIMREGKPFEGTLLLSHLHWDHIQGLPFFVPAYRPDSRLTVVGARSGLMTLGETLAYQMAEPVFPVRLDQLPCALETKHVRPGESFATRTARVRVARGHHPGGVLAYRIDYAGSSIVYATDTEHFACTDAELLKLAADADMLIYDAQYTPSEYEGQGRPSKLGWGHSTYEAGAKLAREAGVRQLVLFHHDPSRTDTEVLHIETSARALFSNTTAAREAMTLTLAATSQVAA